MKQNKTTNVSKTKFSNKDEDNSLKMTNIQENKNENQNKIQIILSNIPIHFYLSIKVSGFQHPTLSLHFFVLKLFWVKH